MEDVPFKGRREKFKRIGGTLGAARDVSALLKKREPLWQLQQFRADEKDAEGAADHSAKINPPELNGVPGVFVRGRANCHLSSFCIELTTTRWNGTAFVVREN